MPAATTSVPNAAARFEPLTVPIGIADSGDVLTIGLRRDGPHGLVAGTTASGKSELLQTILAGLAATHPPEQLGFVLVDYKGGAAFSDMARLPHALGVVTDLDGRLAARALLSLNSELRRRERLLGAADVPNIAEYERTGAAASRPLPNLLIVVDELATLVQEVPGFVDALVDVAQRGRSLGVHLLLSTQSPGGVVSPKIQANLNLWICLRVTLPSESQAVIGTDLAAAIPVNAAGRGYVKVGARLTGFQAVRVTRPAEASARSRIRIVPFLDDRPPDARPWPLAPGVALPCRPGPTEARLLVDRLASEAERLLSPRFPSPWAPPLPAVLLPGELPDEDPQGRRLRALVGLVDEPELQRRTPGWIDFSDVGTCVVLGAFGSGRTTFLRQVALDLALRYGPGDLHIYGIDAGDGALAPLARLPHCATVAGVHDAERTTRVGARLCRLVEERRALLAVSGAADWAGLRAEETGAGPWIQLLLDDYPAFAEVAETDRMGTLAAQLVTLVRHGPQVGIHVLVAAGRRGDMPSGLFGLFGSRILFRQADSADYDLAGLPRELQPSSFPPGRAWMTGAPPREVQMVLPAPDGAFPPPEALDVLASCAGVAPERLPRPVPPFPSQVALERVLASHGLREPRAGPRRLRPPGRGQPRARRTEGMVAAGAPAPPTVVLGVGGPELEAVGVDLGRAGPHLLIAGPERLGRSTALLTCMGALAAGDRATRFVVLAPRPSPLRSTPGGQVVRMATTSIEIAQALDLLESEAGPGIVLVADDCESLPQEAAPALSRVLRRGRETGVHGLFAGRPSDLCHLYEDWVRYLRSQRTGVLLAPDPADADLFDLRLPSVPVARLPGRGYLVDGHNLVPLQVAVPSAR
jgi:S-DNA-T family DNA segregation ATPase FtsK/SpoIIIE